MQKIFFKFSSGYINAIHTYTVTKQICSLWLLVLTIITTWSMGFGDTCILPENAYDKSFKVQCPGKTPDYVEAGEVESFCIIEIVCAEEFLLGNVPNTSTCRPSGTWSHPISECRKMCEKIKPGPHLQTRCITDNEEVNCNHVLLSKTKLFQTCEKFYRSDKIEFQSEIICDINGEWSSSLINCIPDCGRDAFHTKTISGGEKKPDGYSPWQVAIFNDKKFICGGTIISELVVISAAHCFSTSGTVPENLNFHEIAVGKSDRTYEKDNTETVFHKVAEVRFSPAYKGAVASFVGDISLIILIEPIQFNAVVAPACLDRSKTIKLRTGDKGEVSGWGTSTKNSTTTLLTATVTYMDNHDCWNTYEDMQFILTPDKFCTESVTEPGDSGGGFIYYYVGSRSHYLYGIVSTRSDELNVGIFVNISPYIDFIVEVLNESIKNRTVTQDTSHKDANCVLPSKSKIRNVTFSKRCSITFHHDTSNSKKPTLAQYCTITTTCKFSKQMVNSECRNGEWIPAVPECSPDCGKLALSGTALIFNGTKEEYGASPWHVAIYNVKKKDNYVLICGGTIISVHLVISAAHCFYDNLKFQKNPPEIFEIMVSKRTRNYFTRDGDFQKAYKVKEIRFSDSGFAGLETNFFGDIAILVLREKIKLSNYVLLACVDVVALEFNPGDGAFGKVVGWGMDESGKGSEALLQANFTYRYLNHSACLEAIKFRAFITGDKFCAGVDTGPGLRDGDSGGGLLFKDPVHSLYYIRGIASLKPFSNSSTALFTDVSYYSSWIAGILNEFKEENKTISSTQPKTEEPPLVFKP